MTASSNKTTRSSFICDRPALMPSGRGRQHTSWDGALECVEVVDLTGSDQQGGQFLKRRPGSNDSYRAQGGSTLNGDRVRKGTGRAGRDGDDGDNDDDDLPPLLDILSGMKPKGAVGKGTPRLTQQPVGGSGLRGDLAQADTGIGAAGLKPGDSQAKPIELDHDGLDDTTSSFDSTSVGGQLGTCASFCDLSSEIDIDSALTGAVSVDQRADNADYNSVNEEGVDDSQRSRPAAHRRSNWSAPDGQTATEASDCNSSGRVPPASAGNIHDVFAEYERTLGRDRARREHQRQQQRSSSSALSNSASAHPTVSISATMTPHSKASGPSITEDSATWNHNSYYGRQNTNKDTDKDSSAKLPKALVPLNEGLRESLQKQDLAPVIQPPDIPPTNRCTEAFRQLERVTPPMSRSLPVVAAAEAHNDDLLDHPVKRPIETDGQELYVNNYNYEGLDNELSTEQTQSSPPQAVSTLHHSLLSVIGSTGTRDTEISQVPSRMGGQVITHNSVAKTDDNDNKNLVSPLLKEQQDLKASFNGNAQLPAVSASPQRCQRPQTRSRRPKRSIACGGGTAGPDLTSASQATTSKETTWKRRRVDLRPILDGKEICARDYVFVRCSDDGDDEEGGANLPEIARVEKVYPDGRLRVLWAYHPAHPDVPRELEFGPYEILLSDHKDTVQVGCLMGFAEVEENCESCGCALHWCWNKRYKAKQRKIVVSDRPAKRQKLGVCEAT